jgi:hypothetical protein
MPKANSAALAASMPPLTSAAGGLGGLVAAARPSSLASPSSPGLRAAPNGHQTAETAGSDFVVLAAPKRTTIGVLFKKDGDGGTYVCTMYCPEPVVVIGLDGRGEPPVAAAIRAGRKVFYLDASTPFNVMEMEHEQAQATASESLRLITRNYEWAIEQSITKWGRGTLVLDTSTELRDLVRVAVRGRVDRPRPQKGEGFLVAQTDAIINRTLKYFADRARNSKLNLILLSRAKEIYDGRDATGRFTFDTDKVFLQACDWIAEYRKVAAGSGLLGMPMGGFIGTPPGAVPGAAPIGTLAPGVAPVMGVLGALAVPTYEIVATNPKLAHGETGAVYRQAEWEVGGVGPFAYLCERVVPGSTAGDWK